VDFDWDVAWRNIQAVRPGMETVRVSSKTGSGMGEFVALLDSRLAELRGMAVP
jgi:Ni2+-binding GTPase involved in maturation of urease and hydrogenase